MSRSRKKTPIVKDKEYGQKEFNRSFRRKGKTPQYMEDTVYKRNSGWSVRDWRFRYNPLVEDKETMRKVRAK